MRNVFERASTSYSVDSFLEGRFGKASLALELRGADEEKKVCYFDKGSNTLYLPQPFEDDEILYGVEGFVSALQINIVETKCEDWTHPILSGVDVRAHSYFLYRIGRLMRNKRLSIGDPQSAVEKRVDAWKARLALRLYRNSAKPSWFTSLVGELTGKNDPIKALPKLPQRASKIWEFLLEALLSLNSTLKDVEVMNCFKSGRECLAWRYRTQMVVKGQPKRKIRINPTQLRQVRTLVQPDYSVQDRLEHFAAVNRTLAKSDQPIKRLGETWLLNANKQLDTAYKVFYQIRRLANTRFEEFKHTEDRSATEVFRELTTLVTSRGNFIRREDITVPVLADSDLLPEDAENDQSFPALQDSSSN
jgi:hypothetical protein